MTDRFSAGSRENARSVPQQAVCLSQAQSLNMFGLDRLRAKSKRNSTSSTTFCDAAQASRVPHVDFQSFQQTWDRTLRILRGLG